MDDRVAKLKTPEACETFAKNAVRHDRQDLAEQAKQRAVELRADVHGAQTQAEKECLQAIYAYEESLYKKHGKRVRTTYTWRAVETHGILKAAERAVARGTEIAGFKVLDEMGLREFAFEAVILRHPELFSEEAVARSKQRLEEWEQSAE